MCWVHGKLSGFLLPWGTRSVSMLVYGFLCLARSGCCSFPQNTPHTVSLWRVPDAITRSLSPEPSKTAPVPWPQPNRNHKSTCSMCPTWLQVPRVRVFQSPLYSLVALWLWMGHFLPVRLDIKCHCFTRVFSREVRFYKAQQQRAPQPV